MNPKEYEGIRLILRGEAVGGITRADVERRARELCLIRTGREDYAEEDLVAAQRELLIGQDPAAAADDAETFISANRDPSDPVNDAGAMPAPAEPEDENAAPEKLAIQGVEEAQHDQMIEARKQADDMQREEPRPEPKTIKPTRRKRGRSP